MKIFIRKARNGFIIKVDHEFNEDENEINWDVIQEDDSEDEKKTFESLVWYLADALGVNTWGKYEQKNMKIIYTPGSDIQTIEDQDQIAKLVEVSESIVGSLVKHFETDKNAKLPERGKWSDNSFIEAMMKAYKKNYNIKYK
jgi:hypothetical protein